METLGPISAEINSPSSSATSESGCSPWIQTGFPSESQKTSFTASPTPPLSDRALNSPDLGVAPKRPSWAGTRGAFTKVKGSRETLPSWFPRTPAINGHHVFGALVLGGLRPDPIAFAFLLSPLAGQLSPWP